MSTQGPDWVKKEFEQAKPSGSRFIDKQMDIAAQIARQLRKYGITQKALAERAGLNESQLSDILAGNGNPTLKTLVKIEEALDEDVIVTPDFFIEDLHADGRIPYVISHKGSGIEVQGKSRLQHAVAEDDSYASLDDFQGEDQLILREPGAHFKIPA